LSIQGSKQTTKVLYLTYWSNPMWSLDRLNIHEWMYGSHPPSHKGEHPKGKPSLSTSRCRSDQGDKAI
jgi:hypothetical protein